MIISVASGKGGTGKTTVAVNLALSLRDVELLDCDVEEPNCNIFLKKNLKNIEDVSIPVPVIHLEKCDFCGKCSEFCEYNALAVMKGNVLVFKELCHGCGGCKLVCPKDAITYRERKIGEVAGEDNFYQGKLNIGEAMATPVVAAVKKKINNEKTVIIDSPPGAFCPVIEAVSGTDYCILVTEPTPFGLSDLKIAVEILKKLNVPYGIVINREGIGDERVEEYCKKNKIPILMKIPHDRKIAEFYSKGIPFVLEMPEWKEKFRNLYEVIK